MPRSTTEPQIPRFPMLWVQLLGVVVLFAVSGLIWLGESALQAHNRSYQAQLSRQYAAAVRKMDWCVAEVNKATGRGDATPVAVDQQAMLAIANLGPLKGQPIVDPYVGAHLAELLMHSDATMQLYTNNAMEVVGVVRTCQKQFLPLQAALQRTLHAYANWGNWGPFLVVYRGSGLVISTPGVPPATGWSALAQMHQPIATTMSDYLGHHPHPAW
ncbi:MAG TPA: hypothetical protein VLF91_00300 [Candidatus Saccharimonadales bacterium]|nr:hypothetical protein [Candidatus Saccharimonadales bacterium]